MAVLAIVLAASPAIADRCRPSETKVFEIDHAMAGKAHTIATLYDNGAWTTQTWDRLGVPARARSGCLAPAQLAGALEGVRAASWTPRKAAICRRDTTTYRWNGKVVFTDHCDEVDKVSRRALDDLEVLLHFADFDDALKRCSDNPLGPGCN